MAVASVAWILAANGKRVVAVDWDLEKPSLHKYLTPFLSVPSFKATPGVIDLLWDYARTARRASLAEQEALVLRAPEIAVCHCTIPADHLSAPHGELDLIPAGASRTRVIRASYFSWRELFDRLRGHEFLEAVFQKLTEQYDHVLVDLPCGTLTDAMSFPVSRSDVFVACFTLDSESINRAAAVARWTWDRIRGRDVQILPLPMRVEMTELELLLEARSEARRVFDWLHGVPSPTESPDYWHAVEVREIPYYADQRVLPTVVGHGLAEVYLCLTRYLVSQPDIDWHPGSDSRIQGYLAQFRAGAEYDDNHLNKQMPRPYQGDDPYTFVSYARDDRDQMLAVVQELTELGFRIWWDEEIIGGAEWKPYLQERIRRSEHLLLFISLRSMASEAVQQELQIAEELHKPLLSVRLDWSELNPAIKSFVSKYQILDGNSASFREDLGRAMWYVNPSRDAT